MYADIIESRSARLEYIRRAELGCGDKLKYQSPEDRINVGDWTFSDLFSPYPEGSRDKSVVECSNPAPLPFLVDGHRYLFKHSNKNYPAQFWAEIIAYKVGCSMGIPVPPAFFAYNSKDGDKPAALIEWFYDWDDDNVRYSQGGLFMTKMITDYDTKSGRQHNIDTIMKFFRRIEAAGMMEGAALHWARVLAFDAIIGNTDRHQDNWGVMRFGTEQNDSYVLPSPAFDNGTSLGHEIIEENLRDFTDTERLNKYISRGTHHPKWALKDRRRTQHATLVRLFLDEYPEARECVEKCLEFASDDLESQIRELCTIESQVPLTQERCDFVISLLATRKARLRDELGMG